MNAQDFFNNHYKNHPEKILSSSLKNFFEKEVQKRLPELSNILEIGSGNYSLFEEIKNLQATVTAIDFSEVAIAQAPQSAVKYFVKSLTEISFFSEGEFDLVFDSHCMNCLVEVEARNLAFKNIYRALKTDGLFAAELMVQPEKNLNKNWNDRKIEMPFKKIKSAHELEEEILSHKFSIIYFTISRENSFVNELNGEEIFCDVLRVIAKKT